MFVVSFLIFVALSQKFHSKVFIFVVATTKNVGTFSFFLFLPPWAKMLGLSLFYFFWLLSWAKILGLSSFFCKYLALVFLIYVSKNVCPFSFLHFLLLSWAKMLGLLLMWWTKRSSHTNPFSKFLFLWAECLAMVFHIFVCSYREQKCSCLCHICLFLSRAIFALEKISCRYLLFWIVD